jgi:hypothetical protein
MVKLTAMGRPSAVSVGLRSAASCRRLTTGGGAQRLVTPLLMVGNNRYEIDGAALGRRERPDAHEQTAPAAYR